MSIRGRSVRAEAGERRQGAAGGGWAGRLIPIILTVYLTPALLAVLLVGGIGLLVLAVARGIIGIVHGRDARPAEERLLEG